MRKSLISCFFVMMFLIPITRAVTCDPTISWTIDTQFYAGETSKLIAIIKNTCDTTFDVKTEVNTEKTYGYIKIYSVSSEDQKPMPKPHSMNVGSNLVYTELGKKDTDDSQKKVVYFVQPDEMTLPGTYTLYENFYVDDVLKESKEIQINVKKPIQTNYRLPTTMRFGDPLSSTVSINNIGTEIISSLKVCLSSPDNVVSFSEPCKTWSNIPSKYTDTFNFFVNSITPGEHENPVEIKVDYTTFTGLSISDTYKQPSLIISTAQAGVPYLSYSTIRGSGNLTLQMANKGNGTAYNCIATIIAPIDCPLNSNSLISSTKSGENNVYEIRCGNEIPVKSGSNLILNFNTAEITPSCFIRGTISYRDGTGKTVQTSISNFYLETTTTTTKPVIYKKEEKSVIYIILLSIAVIIIVLIFLKYKKPDIFAKVVQPFQKILERILSKFNKPKPNKKE